MIIEAHCGGLEVECSVIGNDEPETSLPGEIVAHAEWYDYEAKYDRRRHGAGRPARRSATRPIATVRELAARVFGAAAAAASPAATSSSRDDGEVLVNEINTIPGFTETSVFAKLFEASGVPYPESAIASCSSPSSATRRERSFEF